MRTGLGAGYQGYYHEAFCYDADELLLAVVVPFLTGGVEAGEPTVVALGDRNAALVRDALPPDSPVTYLPGGATYARPAAAIRSYRDMLTGYVSGGAAQIRIVGELPAASLGSSWDSWTRYESAINHAYDDFPLWSMCAYDVRVTPAPVLADVARTHPRNALPDGRRAANATYVDPRTYLAERRPALLDRLQVTVPRVELVDPTPAQARQVVRAVAPGALTPGELDDLVVGVSETVTNAYRHGLPPTRVRVWTEPARMVVEVTDRGAGPLDPFAGLLPANGTGAGGLGLWITHQSCDHVTLTHDDNGFTVRLIAGDFEAAD